MTAHAQGLRTARTTLQNRRILLTGCTGIVGCELLGELLRNGAQVLVLLRAKGADTPQQRVERLLAHAELSTEANVDILRGDLRSLGELTPRERESLRSVTDVVHCAALTAFDASQASALHQVNVVNAVELLRHFENTNAVFHHVSSSYVAGTYAAPFAEEMLDVDQGFVNAYEYSKYEAERQLRVAAAAQGTELRIYRPSIVVGSAITGRISNFTSLYPFLRLSVAPMPRAVRIECKPETALNIVPVDWVARAMVELLIHGAHSETYHLTNPQPPSLEDLWRWAQAYSPDCRTTLCRELTNPSGLEKLVQQQLRQYAPYLRASPQFVSALTQSQLSAALQCPQLSAQHYVRWIEYAQSVNWRGLES